MVFYRGKINGSVPIGTLATGGQLPSYVRPGDYCVAFVQGPVTTTTFTIPSYMTQIRQAVIGGHQMFLYGGFVPDVIVDSSFSFVASDNTTGFCWSASFWGGVSKDEPYSFPTILQNPAGNANSYSTQITALVEAHALLSNGVSLNGATADVGGSWSSTGAATDFVGTAEFTTGTYQAYRSTTADSPYVPRIGVLPATLDQVTVNNSIIVNNSGWTGIAYVQVGCIARYIDVNNYLAGGVALQYVGPGSFIVSPYVFKVSGGTTTLLSDAIYSILPNSVSWSFNCSLSVNKKGQISFKVSGDYNASLPTIEGGALYATGGAQESGKCGYADNGFVYSGGPYTIRRWHSGYSVSASSSPYPVAVVLASDVGNADTMRIDALGAQPVAIADDWAGPNLGNSSGRALTTRYMIMPTMTDVPVTLLNNGESGVTDILALSYIVLNSADLAPYGSTARSIALRTIRKLTGWKFILADTNTFATLAELEGAKDRNIEYVLNRGGSLGFKLNMNKPSASKIEILSTCVIAYCNGVPQWSGPVWTINENAASGTMTVGAVGWQRLLERRLIAPSQERLARFMLTDAGAIGAHLIALGNQQWPLPFWVGHVVGTQQRKKQYAKYQSIASEVEALADMESGYDFWIDPATREVQFWNRLEEDRRDAVSFTYNAGSTSNLADASRDRSADKLVNGIYVTTKTTGSTPSQQIDPTSRSKYGLQEEQMALAEVTDSSVALGYAAGELTLRANPLQMISIAPKKDAPKPLVDYHLGSIVKLSVKKGTINITDQPARVFGFSLDISDEDETTVRSLQTTVSS